MRTPPHLRQCSTARRGPYRDIATLNAAAALIIAGKANDLTGGGGARNGGNRYGEREENAAAIG